MADSSKLGSGQTTRNAEKHKQSTKSADEKVYFEVEQHFVDDYQHYPAVE